jgi:hypothetical protein
MARDIRATPSIEYMVVISGLPLGDWPKLGKFSGLEHFRISLDHSDEVTDAHLLAFSRLNMPKLRQVSLAYCTHVTDLGISYLTNFPAIKGLQLINTGITDEGLSTVATRLHNLDGINVRECRSLTPQGFIGLTNSTVTSVSVSMDMLTQNEFEHIISQVTNVTHWTIADPNGRLNVESLVQLGEKLNRTIHVVDKNNSVRALTRAQQTDGAVTQESAPSAAP